MEWAVGLGLLASFAALASAPAPTDARSTINWDRIDLSAERRAIEDYQRYDQLLQNVGWKLVRGNAPFCDRVSR